LSDVLVGNTGTHPTSRRGRSKATSTGSLGPPVSDGDGQTYVFDAGVCCQNLDVFNNTVVGPDCCTDDEICQLDLAGDGSCVSRSR
jgi:hypothetical protein